MEQTMSGSAETRVYGGGKRSDRAIRNLLINRRFQLRWIGSIVGLTCLLFGTLGSFIYQQETSSSAAIIEGLNQMYEPEEAALMAELFQTSDGGIMFGLLGTGAALIIMLAGISLVQTHRVAGPMYALSRMHDAVTAGIYRHGRRFRDGDSFQEVSNSYERMLDSIREREENEVATLEALRMTDLPNDAKVAVNELLAAKRARID
jgi:HAMP domain-containing protein